MNLKIKSISYVLLRKSLQTIYLKLTTSKNVMDSLLPVSLAYESLIDIRKGPKIVLACVVTTSGTLLYFLGYGAIEIIVYSFVTYELLIRFLFLLWIVLNF